MNAVDWLQDQLEDGLLDAKDVLGRILAMELISDEQVRSIYGTQILAGGDDDSEAFKVGTCDNCGAPDETLAYGEYMDKSEWWCDDCGTATSEESARYRIAR